MAERFSPPQLKVGLVGMGYRGPKLLRVLMETSGVRLRYMCDLHEERLGRLARRYPTVSPTTSFQDLLDDPELDAVFIATPVFTHYELAARSLAAGKHTFVEKPLASSGDQAEELIEMAGTRSLELMCGHTFLYSSPVRAVKDLIQRQELGDILFVTSSRVNLGLHRRDVSVVWDLGPHDFSILLYWLGEAPTSVRAVGRDSIVPGIVDVAFVTLVFPSGVVANVELSWLAPSKLRRTVVVGSKKMVVYEDGQLEPVRVFDHGVDYQEGKARGEYELSYRTGDILSPKIDSWEPLALELSAFVNAARGGVDTAVQPGLARDIVRLIEAAEESLRRGGTEVAVCASRSLSEASTRVPEIASSETV